VRDAWCLPCLTLYRPDKALHTTTCRLYSSCCLISSTPPTVKPIKPARNTERQPMELVCLIGPARGCPCVTGTCSKSIQNGPQMQVWVAFEGFGTARCS